MSITLTYSWDVPSPFKAKTLYNSCGKDGSDPRFLRLSPVFRCSVLKCGGNHRYVIYTWIFS